ncbi:hypothetical protein B0T22DRAFT_419860 [Podospora appendiculata]|uniref:Myb-like domain-containing protein n=1 Tax=Podospora appendiculata TaxID=314037 RepID=A0AAE0XGD9_9PEZI|nr:hypothetical protein B0T22DRAFT_419860 [Podospora appendiculata]
MLKKKSSGFKPKAKAPVRRGAPTSSSLDVDHPSTTEQPSQTPPPTSIPSASTSLDQKSSASSLPEPTASQPPASPSSNSKPSITEKTPQNHITTPPLQQDPETGGDEPAQGVTISDKVSTASAQAGAESSRQGRDVPANTQGPSPEAAASAPLETSRDNGDELSKAHEAPQEDGPAALRATLIANLEAAAPVTASSAPAAPEGRSSSTSQSTSDTQIVTPPTEDASTGRPQSAIEADNGPGAATPATASKPKRLQKRKSDASAGAEAGTDGSAAPPKKKPRQKRAAPLPGEEGYDAAASKPKRAPRKRKASASATPDKVASGEEGEGKAPASKRPSRHREATPEDAETAEVDITQVKMADLAKDMHIGKKFSLHDELMERERAKRQKAYEKRRQQRAAGGEEVGEQADDPTLDPDASTATAGPTGAGASASAAAKDDEGPTGRTGKLGPAGEQYHIVDGVIVINAASLQVDRHARAREEAGELEEQIENDFTNHTTSATYLRRTLKPQQWPDEETEKFYHALSMFGTDFDTISRMFRGKQRKHIKLKFNREERANPERISAALVGKKTVSIDMNEYQRQTGAQYETAEAIYAEEKRREDEFNARQKAIEDDKAEEQRKKAEALFGNPDADADAAAKKKGRKGKGKGKKHQIACF